MGWSGSGTFTRLYSWVADKAAGLDISSTRMDADTSDITANGLGNCLTRDGQGQPTANLPMNNFRHTGVGTGVARTDYAAMSQAQDGLIGWTIAAGTADAITATYTPSRGAPTDGALYSFRALSPNATTTPTFAPDSQTAHVITRAGGVALQAGDIPGNVAEVLLRYNSSSARWELLNPAQPGFGTGGMSTPIGTTAQRPGSPTSGLIRFNSTLNTLEYYSATAVAWISAGLATNIQTFTSGSGTCTPTAGVAYWRIRMIGGGGGGGGGGSGTSVAGSTGGATSFGSWSAGAGGGGANNSGATGGQGGGGGSAGGNGTGVVVQRIFGGGGASGTSSNASYNLGLGGSGGNGAFGGAGQSGQAVAGNTGAGGAGGANGSIGTFGQGGGGGAGEYVEFFVFAPTATAYSVGTAGGGGSGGTGTAGNPGAAGRIIVEEHYW